ncbi:hypothetical protein [Saliphagus infecundisoli]|nr:hypothetical protein [Saliphagus infecundisoli]
MGVLAFALALKRIVLEDSEVSAQGFEWVVDRGTTIHHIADRWNRKTLGR